MTIDEYVKHIDSVLTAHEESIRIIFRNLTLVAETLQILIDAKNSENNQYYDKMMFMAESNQKRLF